MQKRNLRKLSDRKSSQKKLRKPISHTMLAKVLAVALQIAELAIKLIDLIGKIVGGMG